MPDPIPDATVPESSGGSSQTRDISGPGGGPVFGAGAPPPRSTPTPPPRGPGASATRILSNAYDPPSGSVPSFMGAERQLSNLGTYRLESELGRGGMGVVFKAHDENLQRSVALKVISPEYAKLPSSMDRLRAEARAAAQLVHPNIVAVYAFGEVDGVPFIAMEYVEGMDLSDYIQKVGIIPMEQALQFTRQCAEALDYAAHRNIVHRDIKPSNIFISRGGSAKVMDFGLAKRLDLESDLTASGSVVGTPNYMAPEQAMGQPVDQHADMYSLGCTLFTMLSGKKPFESHTPLEAMMKHINEPLIIPKEWAKFRNGRFVAFLERMTAKKPQDRYEDWSDVVEELKVLQGLTAPTLVSHPAVKKPLPIKPIAIGGAVAFVLVAGIVTAMAMMKGNGRRRLEANPAAVEKPAITAMTIATATATPVPTPLPTAVPPPPRDRENWGPPDGNHPPPPQDEDAFDERRGPPQPRPRGGIPGGGGPGGGPDGGGPPASEIRATVEEVLAEFPKVIDFAKQSKFADARTTLQNRAQVGQNLPRLQMLRQRVDRIFADVERGYDVAAGFEKTLLNGRTDVATLKREDKLKLARNYMKDRRTPENLSILYQGMVYVIALDDRDAPALLENLEQKVPGFNDNHEAQRMLHSMVNFYGME
ncbi:hypothetical protein BH09SUM1_BH09SUM1_34350 [soil metagenome]